MKKSVHQVLSLVMALCLVLSLAPAAFAVTGTTVTTAAELKEAFSKGGTFTLGDNIVVDEALYVSEDTTLDLNGKTLTVNHGAWDNYAILVNADLTVKDSGTGGKITSGEVSTIYLDYGEDAVKNSLTLKSGTLENTGDDGNVIIALGWNTSTVTIEGGTVSSNPGAGARQGYSIYAQSAVHITNGTFNGVLGFSDEGRTARQTVTGGSFDKPFGMNYSYGSSSRIDFYGTRFEAKKNGERYEVSKAFDGGVTISYAFPEKSGLSKRDDVFKTGTTIEEPEEPYWKNHDFVGWYKTDADTAVSFPIILPDADDSMILNGEYVETPEEPEPEPVDPYKEFFDNGNLLKNLVVGGTTMLENGEIKVPTVSSGDGTATLVYDGENSVYTLTLDTYVYSGDGYLWRDAYEGKSYRCGIFADGDLSIVLEGGSEITVSNGESTGAVGIAEKDGCLAIVGGDDSTGKLTLESAAGGSASYPIGVGIYVDGDSADRTDLLIKDCQIGVTTTSNGGNSYFSAGIMVGANFMSNASDLTVDGATLTLDSSVDGYGSATGMTVFGDISIENKSTVTIKADCTGTADPILGAGFGVSGIECEDGELAVLGNSSLSIASEGTEKAFVAIGISADDFYIVGSEVSVAAPDAAWYSVGVKASEYLEIYYDATLTASGGNTDIGDSCGIQAESFYVWRGYVSATAKEAKAANSIGIGTSEYFSVADGSEVIATGGKAGMYSNGVYAVGEFSIQTDNYNLWDDEDDEDEDDEDETIGYLYARGGEAGEYSYGVCVEGSAIIDGGGLYAVGGKAGKGSRGIYVEPADDDELFIDGCLAVIEGSDVFARGGEAGSDSFGVKLEDGWLFLGPLLLTDEDDSELNAYGGKGVESYGVYVSSSEDDEPAIRVYGGAELQAHGGQANGVGEDVGNGQSYGVWTDGSIEVSGGTLDADSEEESDNSIGICLDGHDLSLTVNLGKDAAGDTEVMVSAIADGGSEGNAGLLFQGSNGAIELEQDCILYASAGTSKSSVGIANVEKLTVKGQLVAAAAKEAENSIGLLMATDAPIAITEGVLGAIGQTAAICTLDSQEQIQSITLTAPAIQYSTDYEGGQIEYAEVVDGVATLVSDGTQKQVLAAASGTIYSLRVTGVNTALSYGMPVSFTASVEPSSMVKIVEERWTRSDGALVISSLDANPAAPAAGTYRYTLILAPVSEKFQFNDIQHGVVVNYGDDPDKGVDATPVNGQLTVSDPEHFVKDVTVSVPYSPPADAGTGTSSGGKKTEEGLVRVELPAEAGKVLAIVKEDGSLEIVKLSYTENGVAYALVPAGAEVKVVDAKPMAFGDVKASDWFAGAVDYVSSRGIFQGTDKGFEPGTTMSRAMLVTVLYRLSGETAPAGGSGFGDVPADAWFADAVAWASAAGIVNGRGQGFEPDEPVTREEIAVMLYRFMQHMGFDVSGSASLAGFPDGGKTSPWAQEAMQWAVSAGLFQGDDSGALNPGGEATRAEVATLVERLVKLIVG